jgi:hypothetical protein
MVMLKKVVVSGPAGRVLLMDTITKVAVGDEDTLVVSGSHGGTSSGKFALDVPLRLAFFNDAGVGKDNAGIAALDMLELRGVAAGTVSHTSARIGDSQDMWDHGVVSHVNPRARAMGVLPGQSLRESLTRLTLKKS